MLDQSQIQQIAVKLQTVPDFPGIPYHLQHSGATQGSPSPETHLIPKNLATLIDHTLLKPQTTPTQITQLCNEAQHYRFASVCINSFYVPLCVNLLKETEGVAVCTVVGFPLGATTTATKLFETRDALQQGAREIDMVIAIGQLKATNYETVFEDIRQVVAASHAEGAICKVIIETVLLNEEEKIIACLLAGGAGADFVKTSTGFANGGATLDDVALMRAVVGTTIGVKASGGIRTRADALAMVQAGANRIGTSSSIAICAE